MATDRPSYVKEAYPISFFVECKCPTEKSTVPDRTTIFKFLQKSAIYPSNDKVLNKQGKLVDVYPFDSLPLDWQHKIIDYERAAFYAAGEKRLAEIARLEDERIEENPLRCFTPSQWQAIEKVKLAKIKECQDEADRKLQYNIMANGLQGNPKKDLEARFTILKRCKEWLIANNFHNGFKKGKDTWNSKGLLIFCAGVVSGEIEIPKEYEHILIRKGKRSLTPASIRTWRDNSKEFGEWGIASHQIKRRGQTILPPLQQNYIIGIIHDYPHIGKAKMHYALQIEFTGAKVPSKDTVWRWSNYWKETNKRLFLLITNPDAYRNKYTVAFGSASADVVRLNQRWEADSTPADVMCSDGRYCIIGIIDVWSRRMKLLVSPTSKASAVAALLRRCIIAWGMCEEFKTDNGADYVSIAIERLLTNLEIEHTLCAPFTPQQKPHIERALGTFSHGILEFLPGYIGHSVADRKQIEARKSFANRFGKKGETVQVAMTSAELQEFCDEWTDNIYGMNVHSTLGMSPSAKARTWTEPVKRVSDERVLDLLLFTAPAGEGFRTVSTKGIEVTFYGVKFIYIAAELGAHIGARVLPMIDPTCMGTAVIYDADGNFLCVATDAHFKGISQQDVADEAKAINKEVMASAKKAASKIAKEAKTRSIADNIRQNRKEQQAKIAELPKQSDEYATAAMDQMNIAIGEIERKKSEPRGTQISTEIIRKSDELLNQVPQKKPLTMLDRTLEYERKIKENTATAEEIEYVEAYQHYEDTGRRTGPLVLRLAA
jgi:hypothetical protein